MQSRDRAKYPTHGGKRVPCQHDCTDSHCNQSSVRESDGNQGQEKASEHASQHERTFPALPRTTDADAPCACKRVTSSTNAAAEKATIPLRLQQVDAGSTPFPSLFQQLSHPVAERSPKLLGCRRGRHGTNYLYITLIELGSSASHA